MTAKEIIDLKDQLQITFYSEPERKRFVDLITSSLRWIKFDITESSYPSICIFIKKANLSGPTLDFIKLISDYY